MVAAASAAVINAYVIVVTAVLLLGNSGAKLEFVIQIINIYDIFSA
jgi:hypothetical protein